MDEKKILLGLLSTAYKMDANAATSILYDEDGAVKEDALDQLLSKDKDRVQQFKSEKDTYGKERYSHAKREVLEGFEKEVKEKFQIDSDAQGIGLVEALVDTVKKKDKQITDDDVKKHPLFLNVESQLNTKVKEVTDTYEGKLKELQNQYQREQTTSAVKRKAHEVLEGMKPILSKDPEKAKNQLSWLDNQLTQYNWEQQKLNDGSVRYLPLNAEGKRIEDDHGNPILLDQLVQSVATKFYDFENEDRSSGGDPNEKGQGGSGGSSYNFKKPASKEEYQAMMLKIQEETPDRVERGKKLKALREAFQSTQA